VGANQVLWGYLTINGTDNREPAGVATLAAWQTQSYLRSLVFTFPTLDLEIDMPASGWGAFLVRVGERVFSVFGSGALNERSLKTWIVRVPSTGKPVFGPHELLHIRLSRSLDGWTCTNSISGTELILTNDGSFQVRDRVGTVVTDSATLGEKFKLTPRAWATTTEPPSEEILSEGTSPEATPPASEPLEAPTASVAEPEILGPVAEHTNGVQPILSSTSLELLVASPTVTHTEDSTILEVSSQAHGQVTLTLPFLLNSNEEKILRHLARFGRASREDLQKIAGRRSATTASNLIHRLHEAGHPLIQMTEGQGYEFNPAS
jgi:hypothetical protein